MRRPAESALAALSHLSLGNTCCTKVSWLLSARVCFAEIMSQSPSPRLGWNRVPQWANYLQALFPQGKGIGLIQFEEMLPFLFLHFPGVPVLLYIKYMTWV